MEHNADGGLAWGAQRKIGARILRPTQLRVSNRQFIVRLCHCEKYVFREAVLTDNSHLPKFRSRFFFAGGRLCA